jgi:hypothetical protein
MRRSLEGFNISNAFYKDLTTFLIGSNYQESRNDREINALSGPQDPEFFREKGPFLFMRSRGVKREKNKI